VPRDENGHLAHDSVWQTDTRAEERNFVQGGNDFLGLGKPGPTVRAGADVLAERLHAESAVFVQQKVYFVR
jgi:hypothetical protein